MSPMCVCVHASVYKFGVRIGQAHACTNPKENFTFFFGKIDCLLLKRKPKKEYHTHTHANTYTISNKIRLISIFIHNYYKDVSMNIGHFSFLNLKSKEIKIKSSKSGTMPTIDHYPYM